MNRYKLGAILAIVLLAPLMVYTYNIALSVRVAEITLATGTVTVQRAETGEWEKAEKGMTLYEGDIVKTGSKSKVVIQLDDGSQAQLTSLSNMTMEKLKRGLRGKETSFDMEVGKSWMKVKKLNERHDSFSVGTPSAVAGVRGTYFSTEVEQTSDSTFDVFEGSVSVSMKADPQEKVLVQQNQRSQVKKGRTPSPASTIPSDELKAGLENGIGGSSSASEDAEYDMNIVADPPTLKAGETGIVKVQFMENGKPYNGAVLFTLSLGGSATFVDSGSNSIEINSNEQGYVALEVTAEGDEPIQINADVDFLVEE